MSNSPESSRRLPFFVPTKDWSDLIAESYRNNSISEEEYGELIRATIKENQNRMHERKSRPAWHVLPDDRLIRVRLVAKKPPIVTGLPREQWYDILDNYGKNAVERFKNIVEETFADSEHPIDVQSFFRDSEYFSLVLTLRVDQAKILWQHTEIDELACEVILPDPKIRKYR